MDLRDKLIDAHQMMKDREPAISGKGGSEHTLNTIRKLLDYDFDDGVIMSLLGPWNEKCEPPWSEDELLAKVKAARKYAYTPGLRQAVPVEPKPKVEWKETNPKDGVGIKKPRSYQSVSAIVHRLVGIGMMEGARKYGRHNYRVAKVRAGVYYDATKNHLDDWWEGEDIDKLSGLPHVIKAICSLYVLADAIVGDNLVDDRPPKLVDIEEFTAKYQKIVDDMFERIPDSLPAYTQVSHPKLVKPAEEK